MHDEMEAIFGDVDPFDPMRGDGASASADRITHLIPLHDQQVLYAPLGVGHHVDLQIAHAAARRLLVLGQRALRRSAWSSESGGLDDALHSRTA